MENEAKRRLTDLHKTDLTVYSDKEMDRFKRFERKNDVCGTVGFYFVGSKQQALKVASYFTGWISMQIAQKYGVTALGEWL